MLIFPDDDQPYCIEADSSDFATGAILSQESPTDRKWHPVAFYSKSLNAVEQNYKIHDKEMMVIIQSLEEWRPRAKAKHASLVDNPNSRESEFRVYWAALCTSQ